ncbi:MAG: hypothetical protein LRY76_02105 [Alphaproteobacteria bacterium]|nr:hypothetical protein [Alphaproteobacteria bacterium]MCD8570325.1 hypothetical protein [Alphaproteobacteria bacterium]
MDKQAVKKLYIKAKTYHMAALLLSLCGLAVCIYLYVRITGGNVMLALENPHYVLFILFPFLPAAFMAFLANRLERQTLEKFEEMMKDQ